LTRPRARTVSSPEHATEYRSRSIAARHVDDKHESVELARQRPGAKYEQPHERRLDQHPDHERVHQPTGRERETHRHHHGFRREHEVGEDAARDHRRRDNQA
jgi:hypothetical protein